MVIRGASLAGPKDLSSLLDVGLSADQDRVALFSEERQFTWRQLSTISCRLASAYLKFGLEPGDRIASLMPNRPASVIHYLACIKAGFVAVPLNYRYRPVEIDHALNVSGASFLVYHRERRDDIVDSRLSHDLPKGMVEYATPLENCGYESLLAEGDPGYHFATVSPESPAFIFFTSGSTGLPKGVTHTRETVGWIVASIAAAFELTTSDVVMPGTSFSHMAASMFGLASLSAGAQLTVAFGSQSHEILAAIRAARPTVMFMLPAALSMLTRDPNASKEDFSAIKACFAGGDKLSMQIERDFINLSGRPIDEGYGMTEIGHAATIPMNVDFRAGSLGRPCPGYEFSIRNEEGVELPAGEPGRLWVRFPGNTIGYWNNPEATSDAIVDGWLDTGDLMIADEEGYLRFHGRKKQIIIHDGSNICPEEVEAAVAAHPAVESVGVVGVHDLIHGENVRAYVTLKLGYSQPTAAEIIELSRQKVGYKAPEEIVFLPQLPMNATGKIDRSILKQLAEEKLVVQR